MLEDTKFDLRTLDFRSLTPTEWSALKNQLIEQARQKRNAELRKAMAYLFAGPERALGALARLHPAAARLPDLPPAESCVHRAVRARRPCAARYRPAPG